MISYEKHILPNGLTLILHADDTTPLVTVNTLYCVGSRNEDPSRTGFAHLFEHLMFGGTPNVPDFDAVVSSIGGDSNAFTNNDCTNYYVTAPAEHLETILAIESDRMRGLDFSERALSVQRKVVTEEYQQRYINQPYGDVRFLQQPQAYKVHPYRWCTIGADIAHVQNATVNDERDFFAKHYYPANAIVAIAGNIDTKEALRLAVNAYGDIPSPRGRDNSPLPIEPEPTEQHRLEVQRDVPSDMLCMAFLMSDYLSPDFVVYDLISDILSSGRSSRMFNDLMRESGLFSNISAAVWGVLDKGLFLIEGKLQEGVSLSQAEEAVWQQLRTLQSTPVSEYELEKVINRFESTFAYRHYKASDRAQNLCYYERIGHIDWVNNEPCRYRCVTPADVMRVSNQCFQTHRANVIYYKANKH